MARVPAATVQGAARMWPRNGLGQTALAEPADSAEQDATNTLTLRLRLATPLPLPQAGPALPVPLPARPPFAGGPACTIEYAAPPGAPDAPAWPLLRQGSFGHLPTGAAPRRVSMELADGPRGGPVFDAQGRLAGLAVALAPGQAGIASASPAAVRVAAAPPSSTLAQPAAIDQIYEAGLLLALQVIVVR